MTTGDSLCIGYDSGTTADIAALTVGRIRGSELTILNTFTGQEARDVYTKLTGIKMEDGPSIMLINPGTYASVLHPTYGDIYHEFKSKTGIPGSRINDFRPCIEMYGVPTIPGAIVVWLNDGSRIIYIPEENTNG